MNFKIKCTPNDFIVEEIASLPFKDTGEYSVYLLKKKEWNTVELLHEISRELNLPVKLFSFGGKKDKYASTSQYITIRNSPIVSLEKKKYSLKFLGFTDHPMIPNLIQKNKFTITLRDIFDADIDGLQKKMEIINSIGYPNYFDDQRFGSVEFKDYFLAEEVLKRHFSEVLKIYLTSVCDPDKKIFYNVNWGDWDACLKKATTKFEKKTFYYLTKNPKYFLSVIKQIPKDGLSNHFSAYTGYIWNEVLRSIIMKKSQSEYNSYPGITGEYVFYSRLNDDAINYLQNLFIPTLPYKTQNENNFLDEIHTEIMEKRGIKYSMFNKIKLRQVFFKSTLRKAIVKPEKLIFDISQDELYPAKKKLILNFTLPRGSYGTMLIKRIS
ncbi:tRNA pseudouridine(13) synthase TruD [Candidatus Poribacteria bacterium]|nr:tRNA pseudouridine(13) synthase TruD [Candidatus Poribacteria bacterium]